MKVVDNYKGIDIKMGCRGASTVSYGTHKNAGKKNKIILDSIVYVVSDKEYSFSISKGSDYSDFKKIVHDEIDLKIRQNLPKL